ncbi:MAG: S-layer homology domain-containing protein [bacterium]|nr:S-layer homology domain-containing protein [bacterium]
MRTKAILWISMVLIMALGGLAYAATMFSDVDQTHVQYRDIEFAVEEGWFQGYGDGTYRPDQAITHKQIVIVIERAFPDGASRADMATFLRGGAQRLAAVPEPSAGCSSATFDEPANPGCLGVSGDWTFTLHSANTSSWRRSADPGEGLKPITISVTARYDGDDDVGSILSTHFELFVGGRGYRSSTLCADQDYYGNGAPNLLAGNAATFKVCFAIPEASTGPGALLKSRTISTTGAESVWHRVVIP